MQTCDQDYAAQHSSYMACPTHLHFLVFPCQFHVFPFPKVPRVEHTWRPGRQKGPTETIPFWRRLLFIAASPQQRLERFISGGQQDIVFVAGRITSGFSTAHTETFLSERLRTRQGRGRSPLRPLARSSGSFVGCNARAPPPGETVFRPSPVQLAGTVSHLCPW
jgi:hypothetical protein